MKLFFLLILSSSLVLCTPTGKLDNRIVGGEETDIRKYPHQLSLQYNGSHICGASIIRENIALTAAHCTDLSVMDKDLFKVRAGSSYHAKGGQLSDVIRIVSHENFDPDTYKNDVCILKLADNILSNGISKTIPLATSEVDVGSIVTVSGWGDLKSGGDGPEKLYKVDLQIISRTECQKRYPKEHITQEMICALTPKKDSCQGDSGGPMVINNVQVGIVSWGYDCGDPLWPGIYTNVAQLKNWILVQIQKLG